MLAALVVLIMIAISNYSALFFCCFATDYYGLWLQTYHRKDLACLRILVWLCVCVIYLSVLVNCVFRLCSTLLMEKVSFLKHTIVNDVNLVLLHGDVYRSRMVWLSTPHGQPSPLWSTSLLFCTCGVWTGAQQQQRLCASCLERWWDGKLWLELGIYITF